MKTILLIDGDILCFQACETAKEEMEVEEDQWTYHVDLGVAKSCVEDRIQRS